MLIRLVIVSLIIAIINHNMLIVMIIMIIKPEAVHLRRVGDGRPSERDKYVYVYIYIYINNNNDNNDNNNNDNDDNQKGTNKHCVKRP